MNIAIYCRVSTKDQCPDMQLQALQVYAFRQGHQIVETYIDVITGDMEQRKNLKSLRYDDLWRDARGKRFEGVLVWKYDRFARSLLHLCQSLEELNTLGIAFISETENVDTSTPYGKFFFHILASFAEFERTIIQQRCQEGREYAKSMGVYQGRRRGSRRGDKPGITELQWRRIKKKREVLKFTYRKIAKEEGVSIAHLCQYFKRSQSGT